MHEPKASALSARDSARALSARDRYLIVRANWYKKYFVLSLRQPQICWALFRKCALSR